MMILGPSGSPISSDALKPTTIGGQALQYFAKPNMAQKVVVDLSTPQKGGETIQALAGILGGHDLAVHAMLREIVNLRERVEALERNDDPRAITA